MFRDIKGFFEELKKDHLKDKKVFLKELRKGSITLKDRLIGSSNNKILNEFLEDEEQKEEIIGMLNDYPCYSALFYKKQLCRCICLPVLLSKEEILIHEINHAITSFLLEENVIRKVGLMVNKYEYEFNELINDKASREIYDIFKRRGGNYSEIEFTSSFLRFSDYYDKNFYLIDDFYKKFKEIIKESLITLNKNYLVQRVGKENYEEFYRTVYGWFSLMNWEYRKRKRRGKKVTKEIVGRMQKKVKNIEELTKEDLAKFYKELEQVGKKVRILNELPENNEENKNSYHF